MKRYSFIAFLIGQPLFWGTTLAESYGLEHMYSRFIWGLAGFCFLLAVIFDEFEWKR